MSFWPGKRVVVTGATGFLGHHMLESLAEVECGEVVALGSKDGDLTVETQVVDLFERLTAEGPIDVVFHLAGLVGGIQANRANPAQFYYTNLMMGTLSMHYSYKFGVKKFVAAMAGCGYPEFAPVPMIESDFWNGLPQKETAPYVMAKRMLDIQARAYWDEYRFPAIVGMPGNVYGPYDNFDLNKSHVIPALVRKFVEATDDGKTEVVVWGAGKATRDFVYASDITRGLVLGAEKYDSPQLFNLSSGADTSIREVVEILQRVSGFKGEVVWDTSKPEGQMRRKFDISKAQSELGFEALTSLEDGLRMTVDWYRANRASARNIA